MFRARCANSAVKNNLMSLSARFGVLLVRAYQLMLGPFMGGACRFEPSCSEYAVAAIAEHGLVRGSMLAARRVARCHPFAHAAGSDPVPPRPSAGGRG
jgi:putative membrane protein insertion efficiency factor